MTVLPSSPARRRMIAGLAALAVAAACGRRAATGPGALPPGAVTPPRFGDTNPHPWSGRPPSDYPVHGIDASRFQLSINWAEARQNGVNFAFLKATEGGDLIDSAFHRNWQGAAAAGVPRGAYHFWYHCRNGAEQAAWFIHNVPRDRGALPPVLDVEWTPFSPTCTIRPPGAELRREMGQFLDILERHYGTRPVIYTVPDLYRDAGLHLLPRAEFWLRSVANHPDVVYPGQDWTFWQYSGTGIVPGIPGNHTDLNVFAGSAADWARWRTARSVR